ncbi:helix-turn-helix transcriptional regulator [Bacillus sonorensis]|uniref:helix-turn-helix domain-containing protein n=1 Tax=Bacillus sonorensis TaxID=119858 RepID=UPI002DB7D769|nr:helix-turn-helix transcriptional regulator [Bacillus sonorensis]MEC1352551.1 helix-turn-helix transcriptional regulator [Bacillus sonorensis]MEC1426585.1 helix-turn-helix transcriptional regulator [Bacillus sonorensis]
MNKTDLKDQAGITYNILDRLGKGQPVSVESLYKICKCLNVISMTSWNFTSIDKYSG